MQAPRPHTHIKGVQRFLITRVLYLNFIKKSIMFEQHKDPKVYMSLHLRTKNDDPYVSQTPLCFSSLLCQLLHGTRYSLRHQAKNERELVYDAINRSWENSNATDSSVDYNMEVAPLYMAERKEQCNSAGGGMLYLTYPSLNCSLAGFVVAEPDGTMVNSPVCVSKGCDSSMPAEKRSSWDGVTVTDEPQEIVTEETQCEVLYILIYTILLVTKLRMK
jgi:hypothetical protein